MKWRFIKLDIGEEIDLNGWYIIDTWQSDGICFLLLREEDKDGN